MLRLVGNCARCMATTTNYESNSRNLGNEPYRTLSKFRHSDKGMIFGIYMQPDIIWSEEQFETLLPGYNKVKGSMVFDNKGKRYGIIRNKDQLRVRVMKQSVTFKPEKQ